MQFDFPAQPIDRFERCESIIKLRQMIREELNDVGLHRKCRYSINYSTTKFIYARCSDCMAFLRYKLFTNEMGDSYYMLKKYKLHHLHKKIKGNTKKQLAIEMLQNLPAEVQPTSLRSHIIKTLNISRYTFYNALREMEGNQRGLNFRTLLPYLEEKGYVVFQPFPVQKVVFFPELCLCITQNMKEMYLKYGRFIGIDFTYNLIREIPYIISQEVNEENQRRKKKPKQWITGIISGLDSARRLLIYGIAFCYSQTSDSIQKILDNFFQIMGKQCETIISDGGLGIQEAIKKLQLRNIFTGTHLLDAYHIMANLRVRFNNSEILRRLYLASDQEQYYKIFQTEIVLMQPNEQRKFGKFDSLAHKCCISKIPVTFVGLGSSSSMSQKINDLIKTAIPRQTSFSEVITKILRVSQKVNSQKTPIKFQTYPFENILSAPWIKDLRNVMNKYVFRRLLRQIFKSTQLNYDQCRRICSLDEVKLMCQCKFQEKTGLPCRHIIKLLIMHERQLIHQVDQYWILSGKQQITKVRKILLDQGHRKIKAGRPRNSRRNMKK